MSKWLVTGDIHGNCAQLDGSQYFFTEEVNIIILGDFGANFYLNKKDRAFKSKANNMNICWYVVRGNHEARPQNVEGMKLIYDEKVKGEVYLEEDFPNIRYFKDYGIYTINNYKCAVIGGAYSVDKYYRIENFMRSNGWCGWFKDEQLSEEEKKSCEELLMNNDFDFIFSHTCPISWEPNDLFLPVISQNQVDKTMELWLDTIKDKINWNIWCFGHYHRDRLERPHVQMFYTDVEGLELIKANWEYYDTFGRYPIWYQEKSPKYYM